MSTAMRASVNLLTTNVVVLEYNSPRTFSKFGTVVNDFGRDFVNSFKLHKTWNNNKYSVSHRVPTAMMFVDILLGLFNSTILGWFVCSEKKKVKPRRRCAMSELT